MRQITQIFLIGLLVIGPAQAAIVKRIDAHTVSYQGLVDKNDDVRLRAVLEDSDSLLLNSNGGSALVSLKIQAMLADYEDLRINVIRCQSACANFVLGAGRVSGPLGFHRPWLPDWALEYYGEEAQAQLDQVTEQVLALWRSYLPEPVIQEILTASSPSATFLIEGKDLERLEARAQAARTRDTIKTARRLQINEPSS